MSYLTGIDQRIKWQIFFNNTSTVTYNNTETNFSLLAYLKYVQDFTQYYIYKIYMVLNNPIFSGIMIGNNINLNGFLSVPTIENITNFSTNPTLQNQNIEYNILGEIKMVINEIQSNFLLCDGSSYLVSDYQDLFNLIEYTYGGNGLYFNVPNFNSYFPIGGNNQNNLGCSTSNFVSGNNETGANNNYSVSANFGGNINQVSPIISELPEHAHTINDNGHFHNFNMGTIYNVSFLTDYTAGVPMIEALSPEFGFNTRYATTGLIINNNGYQIQQTDAISNLNGVNISPPYISVKYCICYNQN